MLWKGIFYNTVKQISRAQFTSIYNNNTTNDLDTYISHVYIYIYLQSY